MTDRRLQVFHAVAELKSFTRAGRALHMTQPAVTFQVRQLEERFNTRLFDRKHNQVELTPAGELVATGTSQLYCRPNPQLPRRPLPRARPIEPRRGAA